MNTIYYLVKINWHGEVSYGVDEGSYIAGIFTCEEDAIDFMNSPAFKEKKQYVYDENGSHNSGEVDVDIVIFDNSDMEPLFIGGGWYLE